MTPEEYLQQAYRLDQRIRLDTEEVKRIRELSCSVSAICYDKEHVQASHPSDSKRGGGRVDGIPHISTVEEDITGKLSDAIEKELKS